MGPPDPFNRGTPRGSMYGFLAAARAEDYARAAEYLENCRTRRQDVPWATGERMLAGDPAARAETWAALTTGRYRWVDETEMPQSIGRLSAFMGNAGVLLRAYVYMRMLGRDGMRRIAEYATLNANYLQARLRDAGFELAFPQRRASHEFIITLKNEAKSLQLTAMDIAKALLDRNYHAPTTYFPLLIPECLLIEPTETESKETLDGFVEAMIAIMTAARDEGVSFKEAPYKTPVRRLDDVKAARQLDLAYRPDET